MWNSPSQPSCPPTVAYLGVEDEVLGRAGVLAVVHRLAVDVGQGDVHQLADGVVQSADVFGQRTRDLELLDDHLEGRNEDIPS